MKEQWKDWGARLRGLAQGGLYYGLKDEASCADMNRLCEIAEELLRAKNVTLETQKAWGEVIHRIADVALMGEFYNQYDINRYLTLREIAEDMETEVPLRL